MAQETSGGNNIVKDIVILLIIWGFILGILLANSKVRNFLLSLAGLNKTTVVFNDVIFLRQNNVFRGASLYADKRPNVYDVIASPWDGNMFFAGTDLGIFVSADGGGSWRRLDALSKEIGDGTLVEKFFINPQRSGEISFLASSGGSSAVYRSRDNLNSVFKDYEIDAETMKRMSAGRSVSSVASQDNFDVIGTRK